jgi:hypothetical protein
LRGVSRDALVVMDGIYGAKMKTCFAYRSQDASDIPCLSPYMWPRRLLYSMTHCSGVEFSDYLPWNVLRVSNASLLCRRGCGLPRTLVDYSTGQLIFGNFTSASTRFRGISVVGYCMMKRTIA